MRYRLRALLIVAVFAVGSLIAGWFIRERTRFETIVRRAETIVLFEGLPHPMYEEELLEQERRTKQVQDLNGYPFYTEPMELGGRDAKQLSEVLGDSATFRPFKVEKKCGGFHPDFAVEFKRGIATTRVLICFGCGEAKVAGQWGDSRHELSPEARKSLSSVLKGYRQNRSPNENRNP